MKESKAPSLGRTPAQKFLDKWQGLIYLIPWGIEMMPGPLSS